MSARGRICLYAPYLYPVTTAGEIPFSGGAEVQQWLLARGLAARGFDVSVATCDYGQPPRVVREGVTLLRTFPPHRGAPVLRFFHPRLTQAVSALWRADADVYFVQGSGLAAGLAYDVARLRRRAFVFLGAHDFDAVPELPFQDNGRDKWWYRRALKGADAVIAQTEHQRGLFATHFAVDSTVITNPAEIPVESFDPGAGRDVVWLATYKPGKRPEWFTALAAALPQHRFVMRGVPPEPPLTREAWDAAHAAAETLGNLDVGGFVEHEQLAALYRDAALFVHTSPAEGLPNTMLEAWGFGIPSVTCVNPDGMVTRHGLGEVADTFEELVAKVARLMAEPEARRAMGARARRHLATHHAPDVVYDQTAAVLDRSVAVSRARRGGRTT